MLHLEGSGTLVLYIGGTVLKVWSRQYTKRHIKKIYTGLTGYGVSLFLRITVNVNVNVNATASLDQRISMTDGSAIAGRKSLCDTAVVQKGTSGSTI